MNGKIYEFDDYLLDVSEKRLQKDGEDVSLSPRVFEVLTVLVKSHEQLVSYDVLMEEVWQDTFVEETNLRYCIHSLRKILEEDYIETVPKNGYRFNAEVITYTKEEFIKRHLKSADNEIVLPVDGQETEETLDYSVSKKPFPIHTKFVATSLLLIITVGLFAYYQWQPNKNFGKAEKISTIAVLPFSTIGKQTAETQEFQRGLNKEIVFNLQKIGDLGVVSGEKFIDYEGENTDYKSIGKELNTDRILTGTCRFEDDEVRVNYRLLLVETGENIISRSISIEAGKFIDLEDSISLQIVRLIAKSLIDLREEFAIKDLNLSPETKANFLTAQKIPRENEFNRWKDSAELFRKVIAARPDWALAKAKLANSIMLVEGKKGCPEAIESANKAIELDETIAEAHFVLGYCHQLKWSWSKAEKAYQKVIQLNPYYNRAYLEYGLLLDAQRRFAEADLMYTRLVERSPFVPFYLSIACENYYYYRQFEKAISLCKRSVKIEPEYWHAIVRLERIYVFLGDTEKILELKFGKLSDSEKRRNPQAKALMVGDLNKYLKLVLETRKKRFSNLSKAAFYAQLKDKEKTLDYLEKGVENSKFEIHRLNADPVFDFVRNEETFINLLKRINLLP